MKNIVVLDLDGTLIPRSTKKISEFNKIAINKLREQGVFVCVASGRNNSCAINTLDVNMFDALILSNGSHVITNFDEFKNPIDKDVAKKLIGYLNTNSYKYYILTDENRYTPFKDDSNIKKFCSLYNISPPAYKSKVNYKNIFQLIVCEDSSVYNDIIRVFPKLNIYSNPDFGIDIYNSEKSEGLQSLINLLNIDSVNITSIGNSLNDVTLLNNSNIKACMESSPEEVISICDYVLKDNDESIGEFLLSKFK